MNAALWRFFLLILALFLVFDVPGSGAAVTGSCISAPSVQDFVVSAKSGGIVWLGVGNVGVFESFMARPNYELVKHM